MSGEYCPDKVQTDPLTVMTAVPLALVVATSVNWLFSGALAGAPVKLTFGFARLAVVVSLTGVANA